MIREDALRIDAATRLARSRISAPKSTAGLEPASKHRERVADARPPSSPYVGRMSATKPDLPLRC
jgi:hypothetical protein